MKIKKVFKGFTLAEVLVTLAVIGVVASMVLPGVMNDTRDKELKSMWKKTFADIDQAMRRFAVDQGGDLRRVYNSDANFQNAMVSYFDPVNVCRGTACWDYSVKLINGQEMNDNDCYYIDPDFVFTLKNGVIVGLIDYCTYCGEFVFLVDVNGKKPPNIIGKDVFIAGSDYNGMSQPAGRIKNDAQYIAEDERRTRGEPVITHLFMLEDWYDDEICKAHETSADYLKE